MTRLRERRYLVAVNVKWARMPFCPSPSMENDGAPDCKNSSMLGPSICEKVDKYFYYYQKSGTNYTQLPLSHANRELMFRECVLSGSKDVRGHTRTFTLTPWHLPLPDITLSDNKWTYISRLLMHNDIKLAANHNKPHKVLILQTKLSNIMLQWPVLLISSNCGMTWWETEIPVDGYTKVAKASPAGKICKIQIK